MSWKSWKRSRRKFVQFWAWVALACLSGVSPKAQATTLVYAGDGPLAEQSDAVVVGRVLRLGSEPGRNGGVRTRVVLEVTEVIAGNLSKGTVELVEWGGQVADRLEKVFGAPKYRPGERVLVFVRRTSDGSWQTTNLALGKYALLPDTGGKWRARRDLEGAALFDPRSRRFEPHPGPSERDAAAVIEEVQRVFSRKGYPRREVQLPDSSDEFVSFEAPFSLLAQARWFEADLGLPVPYYFGTGAQAPLDSDTSRAAVEQGMAAWSNEGFLRLEVAGTVPPGPFAGCPEESRISFGDPFQEVANPVSCSGILALGGFCTSSTTRPYAGANFSPIVVGKIVFNDGWEDCGIWTECNLAEVATHELGHTIGLGHSTDRTATMAPTAHFDGRCASLRSDDLAGLAFLYGTPVPDLVVRPRPPVNLRIPRGSEEGRKQVTITIEDAAALPSSVATTRSAEVVVEPGDCPGDLVSDADFDAILPGAQSSVTLNGGKARKASVTIRARAADISGTAQSPFRCTAQIEVRSATDASDQNPGNNRIPLVINVIDGNESSGGARLSLGPDTVVAAVNPVRITLSRTAPFAVRDIRVRLWNVDQEAAVQRQVEVAVDDGDCPAGTLGGWDFGPEVGDQHTVVIAPGKALSGFVTLTPPSGGFYSVNRRSPSRCTLWVRASAREGEVNTSNNATPVVLDVVDQSDF